MTGITTISEVFDSAIEFIFPPLCLGCGDYTEAESSICPECVRQFSLFKQPFCLNCMAFYSDKSMCMTCKENTIGLFSYAAYASSIKEIIIQYKFKGITKPAEYFAALIMKQFRMQLTACDVKYLIPIPLYRSREKSRGYNQATLFAEALALYLKVPVNDEIIFRTKKRKPQARLPVSKRASNISSVFEVETEVSVEEKCILVDDVVTTGNTVLEVKKRLEEKGYKVEAVVSIAHAL